MFNSPSGKTVLMVRQAAKSSRALLQCVSRLRLLVCNEEDEEKLQEGVRRIARAAEEIARDGWVEGTGRDGEEAGFDAFK